MDISGLSGEQLRSLEVQIKQQLKKIEQQEMAAAREQILAIAHSVGVSVKDLIGGVGQAKPAKTTGTVAVRYRNPDDTAKGWTGRGRQPQWIKDWVASGKSLDEIKV